MDFLTVLFFVLSLISSLLTGRFAGAALLRGAEEGARLALTLAGALCGNLSANLLGLGNAATPLGVQAVQQMKVRSGGDAASDEMCMLIVMNTASMQLLPTTVASVRAGLGAAKPFEILVPVWLASVCSVGAGIFAAKVLRRFL